MLKCLRRVEHLVETEGLHAAGFVSYEAAPAFDRALTVREAPGFPLLWFGLFPSVETMSGWSPAFRRKTTDHPPTMSTWCPGGTPAAWLPSVTAEEYAAVIARLRDAIAAGQTYQVNYTFRLRQPADGDPWNLFKDLVAAQQPPYAAYVETPEWAICSASPELFFELDGRRIVSRPMKGTIARGRWYEEDLARARELAASEKDRAENAMIVDMMRNDLGRIAQVASVQVSVASVQFQPLVGSSMATAVSPAGREIASVTVGLVAIGVVSLVLVTSKVMVSPLSPPVKVDGACVIVMVAVGTVTGTAKFIRSKRLYSSMCSCAFMAWSIGFG